MHMGSRKGAARGRAGVYCLGGPGWARYEAFTGLSNIPLRPAGKGVPAV